MNGYCFSEFFNMPTHRYYNVLNRNGSTNIWKKSSWKSFFKSCLWVFIPFETGFSYVIQNLLRWEILARLGPPSNGYPPDLNLKLQQIHPKLEWVIPNLLLSEVRTISHFNCKVENESKLISHWTSDQIEIWDFFFYEYSRFDIWNSTPTLNKESFY